jgi:hypothetical protein
LVTVFFYPDPVFFSFKILDGFFNGSFFSSSLPLAVFGLYPNPIAVFPSTTVNFFFNPGAPFPIPVLALLLSPSFLSFSLVLST